MEDIERRQRHRENDERNDGDDMGGKQAVERKEESRHIGEDRENEEDIGPRSRVARHEKSVQHPKPGGKGDKADRDVDERKRWQRQAEHHLALLTLDESE